VTQEPITVHAEESPSEFVTATSHLYRAEMNRMLVWRQRLDITTNWAIILATALTTFTLGSKEIPHYIYSRLAIGDFIPPWFVAATAVIFIGTATILGLSCPSAEELED